MAAQNDITSSLTLKSRRTTLILQRVERSSLVVVFKNSVDPYVCVKEIDRAAQLLRQGEGRATHGQTKQVVGRAMS